MKYSREDAALRFEGVLAGDEGEPTREPAAVVIHLPDETNPQSIAIRVEIFRSEISSPWMTKELCGEHILQSLSMALRFSEAIVTAQD